MMLFPIPTPKIKELKCEKCKAKFTYDAQVVDLAVNTCSFKRLDGNCNLEQMWNYYQNEERKRQGLPKVPPILPKQIPAILKPNWTFPLKQEECGYCGKSEIEFKKCEGCPVHLFDCDLDKRLTALGRNPAPVDFPKETKCLSCDGTGQHAISKRTCDGCGGLGKRRILDHNLMPHEVECSQCGKIKHLLDEPCDINCPLQPQYKVEGLKNKEEPMGVATQPTEFEIDVPDIMVITINKKGRMTSETRDT
jgi:hypothetical protein